MASIRPSTVALEIDGRTAPPPSPGWWRSPEASSSPRPSGPEWSPVDRGHRAGRHPTGRRRWWASTGHRDLPCSGSPTICRRPISTPAIPPSARWPSPPPSNRRRAPTRCQCPSVYAGPVVSAGQALDTDSVTTTFSATAVRAPLAAPRPRLCPPRQQWPRGRGCWRWSRDPGPSTMAVFLPAELVIGVARQLVVVRDRRARMARRSRAAMPLRQPPHRWRRGDCVIGHRRCPVRLGRQRQSGSATPGWFPATSSPAVDG